MKTDENGDVTMLPDSADASSLDLTDTDTTWTPVEVLEDTSALDLADVASDAVYLTPDKDAIAATVDYAEATDDTPATYDITAGEGLGSDTTVALGAEDANVNTDFDATVTTPEGDGTYNVNGDTFKADDSALEIATTPDGSTLTNGTAELDGAADNAGLTTTDGDEIAASDGTTISATVEDGNLTGVSGIDDGESFTVGDDTYEKTPVGILKTDADGNLTMQPDSADADSLDLTNTETEWADVVPVGEDGITINADTEEPVYFVSDDKSTVIAKYEDGTLTALDDSAADTPIKIEGIEEPIALDGEFGDITLGNDAKVTGAEDGQEFTVESGATATINGKTVDASATTDGTIVNNTENGLTFGEEGEKGAVEITGTTTEPTYTVKLDENGGVNGFTSEDPVNGTVSTAEDFTSGTVDFNDGQQTFSIENDADESGATFTLEDGEVVKVSELDPSTATVDVTDNGVDYEDILAGNTGKISRNEDGTWDNEHNDEELEPATDATAYVVEINSDRSVALYVSEDGTNFEQSTKVNDYKAALATLATIADDGQEPKIEEGATSIELAADVISSGKSVTVINNHNANGLAVNDASGNALISNLPISATESLQLSTSGATLVTFDGAAVTPVESANINDTALAGVEVALTAGQTLTLGNDYTVAADAAGTVTVGDTLGALTMTEAATITAPEDTVFSLASEKAYSINDIALTTNAESEVTVGNEEIEVVGGVTYDEVTLTADEGNAAVIGADGSITLNDGNTAETDAADKVLAITDGATVTINGGEIIAETNAVVTTGEDAFEVSGVATVDDVKLNAGTLSIAKTGNTMTINDGADVTGSASEDKELVIAAGATVTVNNIEGLKADEEAAVTALTNISVKFNPNDATISYGDINFSGDGDVTIDSEGNITLSDGIAVTGAETQDFTVEAGATVTINGKTFSATGDADVALTNTDSGFTVGSEEVVITGDDDYTVESAGEGIDAVKGISNSAAVSGTGAFDVVTDAVGTFTIGSSTYTTAEDSEVTFGFDNGTVTAISDLEGVVAGNFTSAATVDGNAVQIVGDDNVSVTATANGVSEISGVGADNVTIVSNGNGAKIVTDSEGNFTFSEIDATYGVVGDSNIVFTNEGIESLEAGQLIIAQDETNKVINGNETLSVDIVEHAVTLTAADSAITEVAGLEGAVSGLDNATVGIIDADVTVNGTTIAIDELNGTEVNAIVSDGTVATITGLNDLATVNTAANLSVVTEEEGTFTFVDDEFTITGDDSVTFETDENSRVKNIADFEGTLTSTADAVTVDGDAFAINSNSPSTPIITADGRKITGVDGLTSGDSISGSLNDADVTMPGANGTVPSSLTINGDKYVLGGDEDGVVINGDEITGLGANASLTVGSAGDYEVNGTELEDLKIGDVIISDENGQISVYNPDDYNINEDSSTDDIVNYVTGGDDADRYVNSDNPETTYDSDTDYSGNLVFDLDEDADADFSETEGSKKVSLGGGDQDVTFGDGGNNLAVVDDDASGEKNISLGDGGDSVVIGDTSADVEVTTGEGDDVVISKAYNAKINSSGKGGKTKAAPQASGSRRSRLTWRGYDFSTGSGIQTIFENIANAIKENLIAFGIGGYENSASLKGQGEVVFDSSSSSDVLFDDVDRTSNASKVNFYTKSGELTKVGFTYSTGGVVDMSQETADVVMKGNYTEGRTADKRKTGGSTLYGGTGNDIALAGGGDYVDLGDGLNTVELANVENRRTSEDGVTIAMNSENGRTTIDGTNFNNANGFNYAADRIEADTTDLKLEYKDGTLTIKDGRARTEITDIQATGGSSSDEVAENKLGDDSKVDIMITDSELGATIKTSVTESGNDIKTGTDKDQMANAYVGENSGVNFEDTEEDLSVNLGGVVHGEDYTDVENKYSDNVGLAFRGITKVQAGKGNASLVGAADTNNTLIAGIGNNSIWGGGASNDLLVGAADAGEEKEGSTTFYFFEGDGQDTITGFSFGTDKTSDKIHSFDSPAEEILVNGSDVLVTFAGGNDQLRIKDAVGENIQYSNSAKSLVAQIDDQEVTFDGTANYFQATGKNATINVVANQLDEAVIHLNNDRMDVAEFYGDIKYLDASAMDGKADLAGNDNNNVITASSGGSTLWGGANGNDTLIGGDGADTFTYNAGNGNDVIKGADNHDVININNLKISDITGDNGAGAVIDSESGDVTISFRNGDKLTVSGGNNSGATFNIDGQSYKAEDGSWKQQ